MSVEAGALTEEVTADSPADRAGINVGDIAQEVDANTLDAGHTLRDVVLAHQPGDQLALTILRGGETSEVKVALGPAPASFGVPLSPETLPPRLYSHLQCDPDPCPGNPLEPAPAEAPQG